MGRTMLVKILAVAAGGLLLFVAGCTGEQPDQAGRLPVDQPESIHNRVDGCNASDGRDPFALNPAAIPNASDPPFSNDKLPSAIQVDENHHRLLASRIGVGVQVYDHDPASGKWTFREPQANLYDIGTGVQHGVHFAGPYWTDVDGSRVKAKVSGETNAPIDSERNIKWLRLEAVEKFGSNDDVLSQVTFIQRVLTLGGQPPSTQQPTEGCATLSVPYTALYLFWGSKPQ
ncbi:MAG: DUF3455 domain-containing protein [Pseudonocardiaceae bacterium]